MLRKKRKTEVAIYIFKKRGRIKLLVKQIPALAEKIEHLRASGKGSVSFLHCEKP